MKSDVPDRGLVREYLLGRLDDKKDLEEQLSREICVNDDLSQMVESIEEEIIEDFLDEALDPADKDAVDGYFLRPPERKEKLICPNLATSSRAERGLGQHANGYVWL